MNTQDSEIKEIMSAYKKYSVYGLSPDSKKPSNYVPDYMREQGWDMVGIYPKIHDGGGFKIFSSLADLPEDYRKFVNVFRASAKVPDVVDEVLEVGGVEVLWLQLGIKHEMAEKRAEEAGIRVISDRCMIIEHKKWFG